MTDQEKEIERLNAALNGSITAQANSLAAIDTLRAEVARLTKEKEKLQEDKLNIDWLEGHWEDLRGLMWDCAGLNLRAAIKVARPQYTGKEQG